MTALFLLMTTSMSAQNTRIDATTVGRINGLSVACSGVYKASPEGGGRKVRVVDLRVGGQELHREAHAGKVLDFGGEQWMVVNVRKPWFQKGYVELMRLGATVPD